MKKVECTLMLDEDAAAILLKLAGGPRLRGKYLSDLLRREERKDPLAAQVDALRRELARVEAELARRAEGGERAG